METVAIQGIPRRARVYLSSLQPQGLILPELGSGARILAWGRFSKPKESVFPGVSGFSRYLLDEGLSAVFSVDHPADLKVIVAPKGILGWLDQLRSQVSIQIMKNYPDPNVQGLMAGLLTGDKRLINPDLQQSFRDAGIMHLLVVSGLHVALWAAMAWWVAVRVFRMGPRRASLGTLGATWGFAFFVGPSAPVLRAALMSTILLAGPFLRRETPALARLFLAGFLLLLFKPNWISNAGFLLSFFSTLGILYGWQALKGSSAEAPGWGVLAWKKRLAGLAGTAFFAWYALAPLSAGFFHQISFVGLISNVILVPASGLLLALGIGDILLWNWAGPLASWSHLLVGAAAQIFLAAVDFFASWPASTVVCGPWNWGWTGAWILGALAWSQKGPGRRWALWAAAALAGAGFLETAARPLRLYLLPQGQELAGAYLETGFKRRLVLVQEREGLPPPWQRELSSFLESRGFLAFRAERSSLTFDGDSLYPAGAFWGSAQQLYVDCGSSTFYFPVSPYPRKLEGLKSRVLECRRGLFHEIPFL